VDFVGQPSSRRSSFRPFHAHSLGRPAEHTFSRDGATRLARPFEVSHCDKHCRDAWENTLRVHKTRAGKLQSLMAHSKAPSLSKYLLHKPLQHRFSTLPAGGRHIPAHQESLTHHLLTKPRRRSLTPGKKAASSNAPWWKGKGEEGAAIASAARWGLMHPAGRQMGASMLQHMTEHEKASDHAFWHKLGYKASLPEKRPNCELFHDC